MFSTISIKGKNYSNTRKLHYLQNNVGEINSKGLNCSPKPQQPWVNKYNPGCTWEVQKRKKYEIRIKLFSCECVVRWWMQNGKENFEKGRRGEDECKVI